jgi:hypothetical protein
MKRAGEKVHQGAAVGIGRVSTQRFWKRHPIPAHEPAL